MAVLVVFAGEPFEMICAGRDGAFLWPFRLVSQKVGPEVSEWSAAVGVWAASPFSSLFVEAERSWAFHGITRMV